MDAAKLNALGPIPKKRGRPPKSSTPAAPTNDTSAGQKKITSLFPTANKDKEASKTPTSKKSPAKDASTKEKPVNKENEKEQEEEQLKDKEKEKAKQKEKDKENDKVKEKKDKGKTKEKETQKTKEKETPKAKERETETETETETEKEKEKEQEKEKEKSPSTKKRRLIESDDEDEEDESEEDFNDSEDENPKGKPGRKKKAKSDSEEDPAPKKRGRPKKTIATNDSTVTNENSNSNSNSSALVVAYSAPATPKKKDGRGRKSKAELAAMKKAGIELPGKKKYIKKGEEGYVRPTYAYVRKTDDPKVVVSVVDEESPLATSEFVVLPEWMPSTQLTVLKNGKEYLPKSMNTSFKWDSGQTTKMDLFGICLQDIRTTASESANDATCVLGSSSSLPKQGICRSAVFNVGGPIWNVEWCPMPQNVDNEFNYMAVASYNKDTKHNLGQIYRSKNIIQIWRVGALGEDGLDISKPLPKFCFGIAHEGDSVISMKWCPVGGYSKSEQKDKQHDRLGLLAASFADGSMKIYCVPHPSSIAHLEKDSPLVIQIPPVLTHAAKTRQVTLDDESGAQVESGPCVRCLEWSVDSEWAVILAGSDDGTVSIWNVQKCGPTAAPVLTLNAHRNRITSVGWSPACKHQFITCGQDSFVKFWDFRDPFIPLYAHLIGGAWMQCSAYPTVKLPFMLCGMDDSSLRLINLHDVTVTFNKWHFGPIWDISTNLYNCLLATCSSDGTVKTFQLEPTSAKKRKSRNHTVAALLQQFQYDEPSNTITFSLNPTAPTIIKPNIDGSISAEQDNNNNNTTTNTPKSTPKKTKKNTKKKSDDEADGSDDEEEEKTKKKTKKTTKTTKEDEGPREIHILPHEKLQVNQVKWNPRAKGNKWVAFGGNGGLLCVKLVV